MNKIYYNVIIAAAMIFLASCNSSQDTFDEQAHRGGRGLMPENTILSQKNAIDYGSTLEMDLQMSKDQKIVVSHDAYLSSLFSFTPEGDTMSVEEGKSRLLYDMPYDSIKQYDVGSKPHPDFPEQENIPAVRPLLSVLIDSVEAYADRNGHVNHYNIEIKSSKEADGKHYSSLEEFVNTTMDIILDKGIATRTMIQSFDERALRMVHEEWPNIQTSYLVGANQKDDVEGYINTLGFKPDIFSPNYHLVTKDRVSAFHDKGIDVIPWTPNTLEVMQELKDMGVDGEITDYPNLYKDLE